VKAKLIFILYISFSLIKDILAPLIYPIAYLFRHKLRNYDKILWEGYLYEPKFKPLFFFLNDSEFMTYGVEYANKEGYYPAWIWKWHNEFMLSYHFNAIRNAMVNWNNYSAYKLGKFVKLIKSGGKSDFTILRKDKKGYRWELREYINGNRYYIEFYLFKRWFQVGWLKGNAPRFEIDLFKRR